VFHPSILIQASPSSTTQVFFLNQASSGSHTPKVFDRNIIEKNKELYLQ